MPQRKMTDWHGTAGTPAAKTKSRKAATIEGETTEGSTGKLGSPREQCLSDWEWAVAQVLWMFLPWLGLDSLVGPWTVVGWGAEVCSQDCCCWAPGGGHPPFYNVKGP